MKTNYSKIKRFNLLMYPLIFAILLLSIKVTLAQCTIDNIITTNICGGNCDGMIEVNASGGSGAYMYSMDGGITFQGCNLFTDICISGTYSIVIDDMSGCQDTGLALITNEASFLVLVGSTDASCNGACDGTLSATPLGSPPYTYLWNTTPVQTTSLATGLCAGTYTVTVTDMNGCQAQDSGTVSEPASSIIIDSLISTDATSCGACDGTATVFVSGGMAPYSCMWSTGDFFFTITNLCADNYSVTITDGNGCTAVSTAAISETGGEMLNTSTTDLLCNGACDGTATVNFTCGDPPCSIIWRDEAGLSIGQTDTTATGLCAGDYFVQVTNNSGCISFAQVTINEPTQITATITGTNGFCPGCEGSAIVTLSDGIPPYTYSWSPSGQTNQMAVWLCAGIHTVIITDSLDCSSDTFMITISTPDTVIFNTSKIDASCGVCNGQAVICVTGGTSPNSYNWSTGSTTFYEDTLCAGTYDVTITDANSCIATDSVTIIELSNIIIIDSIVTADVTPCFGDTNGTITIYASYGTPPYEYSIDSGSTYQSDSSFTGLGAGTYNITVQSADLCPPQFGGPLTIDEPSPIFIPISDTICDNDSLLLEGEYQNTPGTYYDTLLSVNGCDSVVATTLTVNPIPVITVTPSPGFVCNYGDTVMLIASGAANYTWSPSAGLDTTAGDTVLAFPSTDTIYTVTGTNIYGCVDSTAVSVQLSTTNAVACFTADTSICEGNTITFNNTSTNATGYSWSFPGGTTADTTLQNPIVTYNSAGTFDVTLTAYGCSGMDSTITLVGYITVNPLPVIDLGNDTALCEGDNLILDAGAGFTYLWSDASTNQILIAADSGTYFVEITDTNGCSISDTIIVIEIIELPFIDAGNDTAVCGMCIGLNLTGSLGTGQWLAMGGITFVPINTDPNAIACSITYGSVTLWWEEYVGPCVVQDSVVVTFLEQPLPDAGPRYDSICGNTYVLNGLQSIAGSDITWSSIDPLFVLFASTNWNMTGDTIHDTVMYNGPLPEIRDIYLTEANGICTMRDTITISFFPFPVVDLGGVNDSLEVVSYPYTLDAGPGFDTYEWSTTETTQTIQVNTDGWYSVTVTDANGCEGSVTVYVHLPVSVIDWANENTHINIYPNPNKGLFNIIVKTKNQGNLTIELMNALGQVVYRNDVKDVFNYADEIDVSKFAKGTYLLRVNTGNEVIVKEVIVQ